MTSLDETVMRAALAPAREVLPTDAEVLATIARAQVPRRRRGMPSLPVAAMAVVLLLSVVSYSVPVTRAAIQGIGDSFAGWIEGDDRQAPGRALRPGDDAPAWVRATRGRLIAKTGGVGLYVTRTVSRGEVWLDFSLGRGAGIGDTLAGWRERFAGSALVLLGPAPAARGRLLDGRGRLPLLGVTARSVESLELRYAHGPPLVVDDVKGGFVLLAHARREPREIVAYDAAGNEVGHVDVSHIHMPDP